MMSNRDIENPTFQNRMEKATKAREAHGLNNIFSEQTAILNEMVELRSALASLGHTKSETINAAKQEIQEKLASLGEKLYHMRHEPTN